MRAILLKGPGGTEQLELGQVPIPTPKKGEVLVRVHSAAINRSDIISRQGITSYMTQPILGIEVSGTIAESGGHPIWKKGDRVMGLVNGGGYAEYCVIPADRLMRIPGALSFNQGAAIPEVFLTAYQTLFWLGGLQQHESVLIHAGASGVGTAAIQLAKKLTQSYCIVTAGSEKKLEVCKSLGADVGINYKTHSFEKEVLKSTGNKGVNLILDFVGAHYWDKNLKSIAQDGRWICIGILGGSLVKEVNLLDLMSKCIRLEGTLLTPRSDEYKAALSQEFARRVLPYFQRHEIKPVIDRTYKLEEIALAHQHMEANQNIGKILLEIHSN